MKLKDYIQHLTTLMELHDAQEFEVKTRYVSLDHWGQYNGESVEDVRPEQFMLDTKAKIAFVDCDSTDLKEPEDLLAEYKEKLIQDVERELTQQ